MCAMSIYKYLYMIIYMHVTTTGTKVTIKIYILLNLFEIRLHKTCICAIIISVSFAHDI